MVTLIVTIEEELLRRMDTAVQPDLAADGITREGEEGLHFITTTETGSIHVTPKYQLAKKQQKSFFEAQLIR